VTTNNSDPIAYPPSPLIRRHHPSGYTSYESFRPWLRDEFSFRCVYCLLRERWGRLCGEFDLDHFVPQVHDPQRAHEYDNLLYACHSCNLRRGHRQISDPSIVLIDSSLQVRQDGTIEALTDEANRIVRVLLLNSDQWVRWRRMWIWIIDLAKEYDPQLLVDLLGYPDDLPDLSMFDPPHNSKPEGLEESHFARRERGELPATYRH